jgi:hypothetical protein
MHLWQSVAFHRTRCNLLILGATNLCKQGGTGSIPVTSTNFSFMLIALHVLLDCARVRLAGTGTLQQTRRGTK